MSGRDDVTTGFRRLHDSLFTDLLGLGGSASLPATDVYLSEDPAAVNVTVDVAGLDPQSLEVVLDGDVLIVRGGRRRPPATGRRVYQHVEIDWGPFERRVRLGMPVDPAAAGVAYDRGLLHITLPLTQQPVVARVLIGVRIPG